MTKKRILIIDDDSNTTWLMENVLSKEGYQIHRLHDSSEAVATALSQKPDLIILDLMMPGFDGIEVCRQLHLQAETKKTPVLVLSAVGSIDRKVDAYNAGARDFITKPVHVEELKGKIKVWLSRAAE